MVTHSDAARVPRREGEDGAAILAELGYSTIEIEELLSVNPLYETMPTSVFERMSLAATQHGAVNLGQGFPDFGWPEAILEAAARALTDGSNQYAPSRGLPVLRAGCG